LVVGFVLVQASSGGAKKDISPSQAKQEIDAGALVVDIRTREEYTAGHIAQSVWIPLEELANALPSLPHDRMIIVVCRSGVRSAQGRDMLLSAGFTQVACLTGGMQAWVAAGYPTESGEIAGP
jgi:rhodanese-related sulfurtransferase